MFMPRARPSLTFEPLAGVAGEDGTDVQLWLLWLALELDRVGEAVLEDGLDLRPRDLNGVIPWDTPSGSINFSRSSRFVLPLAVQKKSKSKVNIFCITPVVVLKRQSSIPHSSQRSPFISLNDEWTEEDALWQVTAFCVLFFALIN